MNQAFIDALIMHPQRQTRIHIINRATGEVMRQSYVTEPMFVFHHINAYEKPDSKNKDMTAIFIDVCAYDPQKFDIRKLSVEEMFTERSIGTDYVGAIVRRITVNLDASSPKVQDNEILCECTTINSEVY